MDSRLPLATRFHRTIPPKEELELCKAAEDGEIETIIKLLDQGVRINCADFEGMCHG